MSNLLKLIPQPEQPLSRRMQIKGHLQSRPLSQANYEALLILGSGTEPSKDLHGQRLRQARISQQKNPADLATQACISLAQLYALESGSCDLFYTPQLALQAKRRIALLLGKDWDSLISGRGSMTSLVPTPLASVAQPAGEAPTEPRQQTDDIAVPKLISVSADLEAETPLSQESSAERSQQTSPRPTTQTRGRSTWGWVIVLVAIAGAGTQWPALAQMWTQL